MVNEYLHMPQFVSNGEWILTRAPDSEKW